MEGGMINRPLFFSFSAFSDPGLNFPRVGTFRNSLISSEQYEP